MMAPDAARPRQTGAVQAPVPPRLGLRAWLVVGGALAALTALVTWPQVITLRGVNDFGDPLLNAWAIAWVAHTLPTHPSQIFNANIFYPEPDTLAYSETLIVPAVLVAPYM